MKKVFCIILMVICLFLTTACMPMDEQMRIEIYTLETQIDSLKSEISNLKAERYVLSKDITNIRIEQGIAKYVITFKIKQSHMTLDPFEHMKDNMNAITIQIPVDKEYYDSLNVGDILDNSFREGSFWIDGSFGNWNVTVEAKEIR